MHTFFYNRRVFFSPLPAIFSVSLQCCLSCWLHFSHLSFSRELVALNSSVAPIYRLTPTSSSFLSTLSPLISNQRQARFFFFGDRRRVSSLGLSAVQDLDEGFAKLDVESGVDDGVDGTVEVSQPGDGAVE